MVTFGGGGGVTPLTCEARTHLDPLQRHYVPELQALYNECNLVKWKMGLDSTLDPDTNEVRILKCAAGLQAVIRQIQTCPYRTPSGKFKRCWPSRRRFRQTYCLSRPICWAGLSLL